MILTKIRKITSLMASLFINPQIGWLYLASFKLYDQNLK
jgi:hypothetical protein